MFGSSKQPRNEGETIVRRPKAKYFFIKGISGVTEGALVNLEDSIVIGRSRDCDLFIDDEGISREHARIEVGDRACILTDMDSSNGTRVNGRSIHHVQLQNGDEIGFDTVKFQFKEVTGGEHPHSVKTSEPGAIREELPGKTKDRSRVWILVAGVVGLSMVSIAACWYTGCLPW